MRCVAILISAVALAGCPPLCQYSPNTGYGEIRPDMIGHWEGEARFSATDIRPVIIDFYEVGFRFESWNMDKQIVLSGSWGTRVSIDGWDRLDLYFACLEGNQNVSPSWTIWKYYINDGVLLFHSGSDEIDDEGDPNQDAPFYELNRVP